MKKILSCLLLIGFVASQSLFADSILLGKKSFSTVQEAQQFIEDIIQIDELTIEDDIPYALIYRVLQQGCDAAILQDTQILIQNLQTYRSRGASPMMISSQMFNYFHVLQKMVHKASTNDTQLFCKQKYLLYSLLEYSQQRYHGKEITPADFSLSSTAPRDTTDKKAEQNPTEHASAHAQQPPPSQHHLTLNNHNE